MNLGGNTINNFLGVDNLRPLQQSEETDVALTERDNNRNTVKSF